MPQVHLFHPGEHSAFGVEEGEDPESPERDGLFDEDFVAKATLGGEGKPEAGGRSVLKIAR